MAQTSLLHARPANSVNLVGGRLCLDFVNSIGARRVSPSGRMTIRDEKLRDYLDLLVWARHAGVLKEGDVETLAQVCRQRQKEAGAVFRRAIRLREAIYQTCKAILARKYPGESHLELLNEELRLARGAERLKFDKAGFHWQSVVSNSALDTVLALIARSAAEMLIQDDLTRLRQCAGDDCGWIFEDTTRNRSRRWCEMGDCGNVAKVRRFRLRQRKNRTRHHRGIRW
jgi:predicted RNA-binding Zn ribbon-like protein